MNEDNSLYVDYHDNEWGRAVHDDRLHFEMLTLEGAQAGLSWETVLNKREHYRKVFSLFDPQKVARFSQKRIEKLLLDPGIVRNRLKVESTVSNAKAFLKVQKEHGSFDAYIWGFVKEKLISNTFKTIKEYPTQTPISKVISKDLKKRGFRFVGPTIVYAYMQAIGMVNDHLEGCWCKKPEQKWFVYMIECNNGSLYTGIALDLERRFAEHASGGLKCAKYLRKKGPLRLVYQELLDSKSKALQREYEIKQFSSKKKRALIVLQ